MAQPSDVEVQLEPIGDESYSDRTYNQFRAKPVSSIPSVPSEGYVGALAKKASAKMLQERLADVIGVPVSSLCIAYEGRDLDMNLTLNDNDISEPGPAARRAGVKVELNFVLLDNAVPRAVTEARLRAEEEDIRRKQELREREAAQKKSEDSRNEKLRHERMSAEAIKAETKKELERRTLVMQRRPPKPAGLIRIRCVYGPEEGLDTCSGAIVETQVSCRCGQLAEYLLEKWRNYNTAPKVPGGVAMFYRAHKLADEVNMCGRQELNDVGVTDGDVIRFEFVDPSESTAIALLPCSHIAMIDFENEKAAEEAEAAALTKDVIADFGRTKGWPIAPPAEEEAELHVLKPCQLEGLTYIRNLCKNQHMDALPQQIERARSLGVSELDFVKTLEWVREQAPLIIHVDLSGVGKELAKDTHYRNQFETMKSRGSFGHAHRASVENALFGNAYDESSPFDRVKYGVLNFSNDPRGVSAANQYGKDYLMLKRVRLRTTLTPNDSFSISSLGTPDYYAHILAAYSDEEFKDTMRMGKQEGLTSEHKGETRAGCYKEAQFHGEIRLRDHVAKIVVHESHRDDGPEFLAMLDILQTACGDCEALWMDRPDHMQKAAAVPKSLRELEYEKAS